jgi:hypothetical protein
MGRGFPDGRFRRGFESLLSRKGTWRGESDERLVLNDHDIFDRLGRRQIDRFQLCTVRGGAQNFPVQHAGSNDVGGIAVPACHKVGPIGAGDPGSEHFPFVERRERDRRRERLLKCLHPFFRSGQIRVTQRLTIPGLGNLPILNLKHRGLDMPAICGKLDQQGAGSGTSLPNRGNASRGRAATGGDAVVGDQTRVSHEQLNPINRDAQLFCRGLRQLRPGALARLHLTCHHRNRAVLADVNAGGDVTDRRAPHSAPSPAASLSKKGCVTYRDQQPRAENLHEASPGQAELIIHPIYRLVVIIGADQVAKPHLHGSPSLKPGGSPYRIGNAGISATAAEISVQK